VIGSSQPRLVIEVASRQEEGAILLDLDQAFSDPVGINGLAIGSQPHHLVLARIDLESKIIGKRRVKQAQ